MADELTLTERTELEQYEQVIERGLQTFYEVGRALIEIKENGLFKEYGTFEEYCEQRWGLSGRYLRHIRAATEARQTIIDSGAIAPLPNSVGQLRPLLPLESNLQVEAWQLAAENAANGRITARHVVAAVQAIKRIETQIQRETMPEPPTAITPAFPEGKYQTIVIDPPWPIEKIDREVRPNQSHYLDYPVMSLDEITALPIGDFAADEGCHLYLWVTNKYLPIGLELMAHWGFNYQCLLTWVKPTGMTPYSWMYNTEHVLFGARGGLRLQQMGLKLSFEASVIGHSVKPDAFYNRVVLASPEPRLEMFARQERDGFTTWGNEV